MLLLLLLPVYILFERYRSLIIIKIEKTCFYADRKALLLSIIFDVINIEISQN